MALRLYDRHMVCPDISESSAEMAWLLPFVQNGAERFVKNVKTDFRLLVSDRKLFPVTINHSEYESSYVCSPYTHNVSYAKEELHHLNNPAVERVFGYILNALGIVLKLGKINRTIHVNNWLLSTNLYPDWSGQEIPEITDFFTNHYPGHALVFRSVNECHEQPAFDMFKRYGYNMFLTRQVYMFDGRNPKYLKKKNVKWDWRLLQNSEYRWVRHEEILETDIPRIIALYNDLYLDKYSYHNPQFTESYIRLCLEKRILTLHGLRHPSGRLDGIVGYFNRNSVMTTPLVGYDRSLPQELGLYRMLMAVVMRSAAEGSMLLNLSAGAADFKRIRGGIGYLEYSAVYIKHLPFYRRLPWQLLMFLMNTVGTYIMRKYQL